MMYHDFDKDGFSESIEVNNFPDQDRYFIYIRNWSGGIIDQTNYWEPVSYLCILLEDINEDKYDEIIVFTQEKDSLYIYVHDLVTKKPILKRVFLDFTESYLSHSGKYTRFFPGCLAEKSLYGGKPVILFAVRASARLPRAVYAFDLTTKKVIQKFETHAALSTLHLYDLTANGVNELIITASAWGNIHSQGQYRDDKAWLFVLDQKLNPLFPPLSFLEYPAELMCLPMEIYSERFLLVVPENRGEKNISNMMYLIDTQGRVHKRAPHFFTNYVNDHPVVTRKKNPAEIYSWMGDNDIIKMNHQLEISAKTSTPFKRLRTLSMIDLNADGVEEILCKSKNFFLVFNAELTLLSKFPLTNYHHHSFRETGPNQSLEIGLQDENQFYRLSLDKNKLYPFFPLIFVGLTGVVFMGLAAIRRLLMLLTIYIHIFRHFFYDSSDGILILSQQGKILYTNNQLHSLLHLPHEPLKGEHINFALNQHQPIIDVFNTCLENNQPVQKKVGFGEYESRTETEIRIQPFRLLLRTGYTYLVELKSARQYGASDRIQIWSRAVQKMAHDIKTPLSTVTLNLKVLQTRLEKMQLSEQERAEFSDDIQMMRSELDHVQTMTKNFLKFSNLDKPHFQAFDIKTIIDNAVHKYQPFISTDLDVQAVIDDDVKPVWADPQQIEMVFHILLENALNILHGKGIISISVALAQYLETSFSEFLEIEVADTGPGIKEEDKMKIFEPYYTTKSEGTGMGLAIAKKIIEDHGGFIELHSRPNFGAVFRFSLPVISEEE